MKQVQVGEYTLGGEAFLEAPLVVLCGPCVIESEEHTLRCCDFLVELFDKLGLGLVFKASYDKANRSSKGSYRGPGIEEGLRILQKVKQTFGVSVVSDVHTPDEVEMAKEVLDILQVPAFLSRQTDLLEACAQSGKVVEVKKGQFLAPWDMEQVVKKVTQYTEELLLVERGTSFGYNNLVSDFRSIPVMQTFGYPVGFDATHSVQLPGGLGSSSGGQREYVPLLAKASLVVGANFLFMEAHPDPANAKSDQACQIPFSELETLLCQLKRVWALRYDEVLV